MGYKFKSDCLKNLAGYLNYYVAILILYMSMQFTGFISERGKGTAPIPSFNGNTAPVAYVFNSLFLNCFSFSIDQQHCTTAYKQTQPAC